MKSKRLRITLSIIFVLILFIGIYDMCKIEELTHLTSDDLEWADCYKPGDVILFINDLETVDSMYVDTIIIHNSTFPLMNPFLKFETSSRYFAKAIVYFKITIMEETFDGSFFIEKTFENKPPLIVWRIGNFRSNADFFPSYEDKQITNDTKCVIGDLSNSHYLDIHTPNLVIHVPNDSLNFIESFVWCKGEGLKSYRLKNGRTYTLYKP